MKRSHVEPAAIRAALERAGFEVVDSQGRAGDTWWKPGHDELPAVLVPREQDRDLVGYEETLDSAVERLSWISGLPRSEVISDLQPRKDCLELRIVHELTAHHSIKAIDAPAVIEGFVNLIRSGARTHFNGTRADHRGPAGEQFDYALDHIELLAPEPGSFRLVAVTTDSPQIGLSDPVGASVARGALTEVLRSLDEIHQLPDERPLNESELDAIVDAGVSVQLLNAVDQLASFTRTAGLELSFSGTWAWRAESADVPKEPVVVGDREIGLVKKLKPLLQAKYEPREDYPLMGWVETAQADEQDLSGQPTGSVVVKARVDKRVRDVRLVLDASTFPLVKPGISEIRATGTLERVSGRWRLSDPRDIKIVTP